MYLSIWIWSNDQKWKIDIGYENVTMTTKHDEVLIVLTAAYKFTLKLSSLLSELAVVSASS